MRSKLAIPALVVATLFGAMSIASAQMQPAPGASSEGNVGPAATKSTKSKSHMKSGETSHTKSSATTGMNRGKAGSNKGDARNPAESKK